MAGIVDRVNFDADRPTFWMLNVGETHYPYAIPGRRRERLAAHLGAARRVQAHGRRSSRRSSTTTRWSDSGRARSAPRRTPTGCSARLYDVVPPRTWIIVTSDHGELFGEGGYFGHGPIVHDKVLEVPFVEGARTALEVAEVAELFGERFVFGAAAEPTGRLRAVRTRRRCRGRGVSFSASACVASCCVDGVGRTEFERVVGEVDQQLIGQARRRARRCLAAATI